MKGKYPVRETLRHWRYLPALAICCCGTFPAWAGTVHDISDPLRTSSHCVKFEWLANDATHPKGAIAIPVSVDGIVFFFQVDTGTGIDILYDGIADRRGWSSPHEKTFRPHRLMVGDTVVTDPLFLNWRDEKAEQTSGELGLADLVGKTTVIDYLHQRFCLFSTGQTPVSLLKTARWTDASLSHSKFFVPMHVGQFQSDNIALDTGSSLFPLWLRSADWRAVTGKNSLAAARYSVRTNHFADKVIFRGDMTQAELFVGTTALGRQIAYARTDISDPLQDWGYRIDGILGNAAFLNTILVIDMADSHIRLGIIEP